MPELDRNVLRNAHNDAGPCDCTTCRVWKFMKSEIRAIPGVQDENVGPLMLNMSEHIMLNVMVQQTSQAERLKVAQRVTQTLRKFLALSAKRH